MHECHKLLLKNITYRFRWYLDLRPWSIIDLVAVQTETYSTVPGVSTRYTLTAVTVRFHVSVKGSDDYVWSLDLPFNTLVNYTAQLMKLFSIH